MDRHDETVLAIANRHVAEGERRCARQAALIEELAAHGYDTREAERLLSAFEQTLTLMHEHQQRLLCEVAECILLG